MIALGGTIGTGLFIGLGTSLSGAGPLSTLLGYSIMGCLVWALMIAMGEMAAYLPVAGGFIHHTSRFVDPSLGSALAWLYWFSYGITLPTEISAGALVVSYWDPDQHINPAVWITLLMIVCVGVNFLPVKFYGEIEFWFALLKVIVVIMLIITMLVIDVGGGPSGDYIGGRYWRDPGPMAQLFWEPDPATNVPMGGIMGSWGRFLAFWNVFVSAAFAFAGTEIVGVTVGEVENPRKNVPKAIKRVAIRIIVFYVLAVLMVGLVVAYNDPLLLNGDSSNASASPYVIAIQNAGIKGYPHFINAVLLTVTWSAGQSDCYAASRTIYGLALEGRAPHFLTKCTKGGVPIWAVFITALYAPLAYMAVGAVGAAQTFTYLYDISAVSILLVWWAIMITYLRFHHGMKVQGLPRSILPYQAPLQPYLSWFALIFFTLVILLSAFTVFINGHWAVDTFVTDYISIPLFAIVWLGYKLVTKSKTVSYATMDFHTGRRQLEALDEAALAKPEPQGVFAKILDVLL
jgi:amino acid transporter